MPEPRLALVTGAAGAIGGAIAHALARRHPGMHLALSDVDGAGLDRLAGELPGRTSTWRWDLAAPAMQARRAGAIVNVSSMAGRVPLRGAAFYGAAKAGIAMASEIARVELAGAGVHVVTVYPGPVASGLERGARAQLRPSRLARWMPTGDAGALAQLVVRAIDRREPRVVYPPLYAVADRAIGVASWVTRRFSPEPSA